MAADRVPSAGIELRRRALCAVVVTRSRIGQRRSRWDFIITLFDSICLRAICKSVRCWSAVALEGAFDVDVTSLKSGGPPARRAATRADRSVPPTMNRFSASSAVRLDGSRSSEAAAASPLRPPPGRRPSAPSCRPRRESCCPTQLGGERERLARDVHRLDREHVVPVGAARTSAACSWSAPSG